MVHKDHRNKSFGSLLVESCVTDTRAGVEMAKRRIKVETLSSVKDQGFFKKNGFTISEPSKSLKDSSKVKVEFF